MGVRGSKQLYDESAYLIYESPEPEYVVEEPAEIVEEQPSAPPLPEPEPPLPCVLLGTSVVTEWLASSVFGKARRSVAHLSPETVYNVIVDEYGGGHLDEHDDGYEEPLFRAKFSNKDASWDARNAAEISRALARLVNRELCPKNYFSMTVTEKTTIHSSNMSPRDWLNVLNSDILAKFAPNYSKLDMPLLHRRYKDVKDIHIHVKADTRGAKVDSAYSTRLFSLQPDRDDVMYYTMAPADVLKMDRIMPIRVVMEATVKLSVTRAELQRDLDAMQGIDLLSMTCPEGWNAAFGWQVGEMF
jgi:hypothetical protein